MWHHGCIDRFSHKGSIYGSVTFLMVEINYSQVRIKADTRSGRWAVATVGGSINSPNKQAELLRVDYRNSWVFFLFFGFCGRFFLCVFFNKRKKELINETVTTVMFVGIKGGGKCSTAGFDKRLCGHFNVQYPGKELQSGAQRAKTSTVSKSLLLAHCKHNQARQTLLLKTHIFIS